MMGVKMVKKRFPWIRKKILLKIFYHIYVEISDGVRGQLIKRQEIMMGVKMAKKRFPWIRKKILLLKNVKNN